MPRPNPPRNVPYGEQEVRRRIQIEREERGWSYEALARRMTDAGCPIQGSAIFKIEKGEPPRAVRVDELVAFSIVFGIPFREMVFPPEVVMDGKLKKLFMDWEKARERLDVAQANEEEALRRLGLFVESNKQNGAVLSLVKRMDEWAEENGLEEHNLFARSAFLGNETEESES